MATLSNITTGTKFTFSTPTGTHFIQVISMEFDLNFNTLYIEFFSKKRTENKGELYIKSIEQFKELIAKYQTKEV